jgi:hypothetical protein
LKNEAQRIVIPAKAEIQLLVATELLLERILLLTVNFPMLILQ